MSDPTDPHADPHADPAATDPTTTPSAPPPPGHAADAPERSGDDPEGDASASRPVEIGGQKGPEPTRYGDWEKKGRCTDF